MYDTFNLTIKNISNEIFSLQVLSNFQKSILATMLVTKYVRCDRKTFDLHVQVSRRTRTKFEFLVVIFFERSLATCKNMNRISSRRNELSRRMRHWYFNALQHISGFADFHEMSCSLLFNQIVEGSGPLIFYVWKEYGTGICLTSF